MAQQNILLCFPGKSAVDQNKIIKQSINHTVCSFIELAALWYKPIDHVLSQVTLKSIPESFYHSTQAKIIIAPHFGSWELLNLWLAKHDCIYSLYKPAKSKTTNHFILNGRTRTGAHLIPTSTAGLRNLINALKNHNSVMILPDQRPAWQSSQLDSVFFGHTAPTTTLINKLTKKIDCSVFIAAAIRTDNSKKYKIHIEELKKEQLNGDPQISVDYLNKQIERFIATDIEQYQWSYRRFSDKTYGKE